MNKDVVEGKHFDPYKVLGLGKKAKLKDIKKKYRELAKKFHPDVAPPGEDKAYAERFMKINKAYKLLTSKDALRQLKEYGYVMSFEEGERIGQARLNLARMMDGAFDQYENNYFGLMIESIRLNSKEKKSQIVMFRKSMRKYEYIRKGIVKQKNNKENDDLAFGVINMKIDNCKKKIAFENNEIEIGKIMTKMCKTLRYKGGSVYDIDFNDLEEDEEEPSMLMGEVTMDSPSEQPKSSGPFHVEEL